MSQNVITNLGYEVEVYSQAEGCKRKITSEQLLLAPLYESGKNLITDKVAQALVDYLVEPC